MSNDNPNSSSSKTILTSSQVQSERDRVAGNSNTDPDSYAKVYDVKLSNDGVGVISINLPGSAPVFNLQADQAEYLASQIVDKLQQYEKESTWKARIFMDSSHDVTRAESLVGSTSPGAGKNQTRGDTISTMGGNQNQKS